MSTSPSNGLSTPALFGYGLSVIPAIYAYALILVMYMKYAAVELGASTAAVGSVFVLAKTWDAVTDPAVGSLSDRTRSRLGRRRPWLFASAPLLGLFTIMTWAPPTSLEGPALIAWIAVGVIGFYTAYTMFDVPHMALGAELSLETDGRNRIFAVRQALKTLGLMAAAILGSYVVNLGRGPTQTMAWGVAAMALALIFAGVRLLPPERSDFQGRGGEHPLRALRDVLRNRHARLLLLVLFIDAIGAGGIGTLTPFVVDYVVGRNDLVPALIGSYMVAALAGIPLWLFLARHFEKRHLMLVAMVGAGVGYGSVLFVTTGNWLVILFSSVVAGISSSCPNILGYTLKSEIIDLDEHATGERKEGAYFAGWSFVGKLAVGIMIGLVGWALEWAGFDGESATQTPLVKDTMVMLMGGFPLVCYLLGAVLFARFDLTESEHARIRAELDARPSPQSAA